MITRCSERERLTQPNEEQNDVLLPLKVGNTWLYNLCIKKDNGEYDLIDEVRYLKINGIITIDDHLYFKSDDNFILGPFYHELGSSTIILENRSNGLYVGDSLLNDTTVDWKFYFKYPVENNDSYSYHNYSIEVTREKIETYYHVEFDCILYSFESWQVYVVPGKGIVRFTESKMLIHDLKSTYLK